MNHEVPPHWIKGQLLDLQRFGDGCYRAYLLGEADLPQAQHLDFDSSFAAQQFVSAWYLPEQQFR